MPFAETVVVRLKTEERDTQLATLANNLSIIYWAMGEMGQALVFQLKVNNIYEKVLPENHPDLARSYHNLSTIYRDKNQYADALRYAEKAVAILQKLFPNGHPNRTLYEKNLAFIKQNHK